MLRHSDSSWIPKAKTRKREENFKSIECLYTRATVVFFKVKKMEQLLKITINVFRASEVEAKVSENEFSRKNISCTGGQS